MVLGRALGPDGYGVYSFTMAIVGLAAVIAPLGWPVILQRFVAQYHSRNMWGELVGVLVRSFQFTVAAAIVVSLIVAAVPFTIHLPTDRTTALRFAAILIPVMALVKLRRNALQGLGNMAGMLVPEEIILPLLVITGVTVLHLTRPNSVLWLYFGVAAVAFTIGTIWLGQALPSQSKGISPTFATREWMAAALPMLSSDVSKYIMTRSDVLLLGSLTDMHAVGLYAAANRLAQLTPFVMIAVNAAAAPFLASAYAKGNADEFRSVLRNAIFWSSLGALPFFVVLMATPSTLLNLFGGDFTAGTTLLRVLAFGQLVNAASGPVGFALIMSKRERIFALLVVGTAVLNVVGNLTAIPIWGATGAATVTAIATVLLNGASFAILFLAKGN